MASNDLQKVKVVVRVRPLSLKESAKKASNIIQQEGPGQIRVWDPASLQLNGTATNQSCWSRSFAFDRCLIVETQENFYDEVGKPILERILLGFNCCIFAFGHTGMVTTSSFIQFQI